MPCRSCAGNHSSKRSQLTCFPFLWKSFFVSKHNIEYRLICSCSKKPPPTIRQLMLCSTRSFPLGAYTLHFLWLLVDIMCGNISDSKRGYFSRFADASSLRRLGTGCYCRRSVEHANPNKTHLHTNNAIWTTNIILCVCLLPFACSDLGNEGKGRYSHSKHLLHPFFGHTSKDNGSSLIY